MNAKRDPRNPWSVASNRFSARWTGLALLFAGVILAAITVYKDYAFLPGAAYTSGTFVRITGSKPAAWTRYPQTAYSGQYHYVVNGHTYSITQIYDEAEGRPAQVPRTIRVAYKTANPANAMVVHGTTLEGDAKGSIVADLAGGVVGYSFIYLRCAPVVAIQNRKRRTVEGIVVPAAQVDADAQTAVQELRAREGAETNPSPAPSSNESPGKPLS